MDKKATRLKYKEIRLNIEHRIEKEDAVLSTLIKNYSNVKTVFCYESFGSELSTVNIIKHYLSINCNVYVPVVEGVKMFLKNIVTGDIYTGDCNLTIVPLLAFDSRKNRIGYGKGFYDRYLREANTLAVGVAFGEQICENLPYDELDMPLCAIITPDIVVV